MACRRWGTLFACGLALAVTVGACGRSTNADDVTQKQSAVVSTQGFTLPVPVGLNPESLVLGASVSVSINDRARVIARTLGGNTDGDVAAMALFGFTNVGSGSRVRRIFSVGNVTLRGSAIQGYVKTSGSLNAQQGTTFGDPAENRSFVNIRQDAMFTMDITTNDTGPPITVPPNTTAPPIGPGTYGSVNVASGGRLTLTSRGDYFFASLTLEPGSVLTLPSTGGGLTRIQVHSGLIIRSQLAGDFRTVLTFRGNGVAVESPFTGGLFVAPNASVEIKANSTGRFFARAITVFEGVTVTEPASGITRNLFMPFEQVFPGGALALSEGQAEISGTVLVPISVACAAPVALTSFSGDRVIKTTNPFGGPSKTSAVLSMTPPPPPTACVGVLPGFLPDEPQRPYGILPGFGRPEYGPSMTDNITVRLGSGRALNVGLDIRWCTDQSQGPNCPTPTQPTPGGVCSSTTIPGTCYYGASFCNCTNNRWVCGAHNCPATEPNLTICGANPVTCHYGDDYCYCPPPPPGGVPIWVCNSRKRREGRSLSMHMSNDCGGTFSDAALDPREVGISNAPATPLFVSRSLDRQEVFVDALDARVFVAFQTSPEWQNFAHAGARSVILSASTTATTTPALVQEMTTNWRNGNWVRNDANADAFYQSMATVRDERPSRPDGSQAVWNHFVRLRCLAGSDGPDGGTPMLEFDTPFGRRSIDLSRGDPVFFHCARVPVGAPNLLTVGGGVAATVVGMQGAPPRIRAAYISIVDGHQVLLIWLITLRSENGYQNPTVTLEDAINPGTGAHVMFPQFIPPDGFGGSDVRVDSPVVLRWIEAAGDTMTEKAMVFYSSLSNIGLRGPEHVVAQWSVSDTFTGRTCPGSGNTVCFAGDYRYGAFMDKVGQRLRYFTPWAGTDTAPPNTNFANRIRAFGAEIDITP